MSAANDMPELLAELSRLVKSAYDRGFEAGGMAMRNTILMMANAPMSVRDGGFDFSTALGDANAQREPPKLQYKEPPAITPKLDQSRSRAPRGLVAQVIGLALKRQPGRTITELEEFLASVDHRVAKKTVGNELRRFHGVKYQRDGYKWFLMGNPENETPAVSPASASEPEEAARPLL